MAESVKELQRQKRKECRCCPPQCRITLGGGALLSEHEASTTEEHLMLMLIWLKLKTLAAQQDADEKTRK